MEKIARGICGAANFKYKQTQDQLNNQELGEALTIWNFFTLEPIRLANSQRQMIPLMVN